VTEKRQKLILTKLTTTMGQSYGFLVKFFFSYFHCFRQHFISFCNILWKLSVEEGNSSKIYRKTWYFLISANKSNTDETISKKLNFRRKNFGQKFITLAHSGGHNLVKIRFCLFFSHYGSKVYTICLKNWFKSIEFSRKS
jgi:hypothetical protein